MSAAENPGFMAARAWLQGEIIEAETYDNTKAQQGKTLWVVEQDGKQDRKGRFVEARLVIAEDEHLNWWLTKGEGVKFKNVFYLHLCKGTTARCGHFNARRPKEFHTDRLRIVDNEDIKLRKAAWWQVGPSKAVFEKFRAELMDGADPGGAGRGHDDEFDFALTDEEMERKRDVVPAEAEASEDEARVREKKKETHLEKELSALKAGTAKKKDKRAKPPAGVRTEEKSKKPEADPGKKDKHDDRKKKPADDEEGPDPLGEALPSRLWFGRKRGHAEEEKARTGRKKRRLSSSESSSEDKRKRKKRAKKRRKKAKKGDRGPYGIGQKVNFQDDDDSSSSSDSEESVFRGGAPKERSQQLQLMEYALINPGRLTSRLLLKMQNLLAKEGAPINQERPGNMTPAVATAYLLTVLIPTHRERLGVRLLREMRTIAGAVDEIARGRPEEAGDILSQRLKALELQLVDNSWQRAQFLELIPQEGAGLSERSEQAMATSEQMQEQKMRVWNQDPWKPPKGGGNVIEKGKGKGKKGKKGGKQQETTWTPNPEVKPPAA